MRTLTYQWDGEVMTPLPGFSRHAQAQFERGKHYRLDVIEERSQAQHGRYFALVNRAYDNLPESIDCFFRSADALRKWALIKNGFFDKLDYKAADTEEAVRVAKWQVWSNPDAEITIEGLDVIIKVAKSQSFRRMKKKEFHESSEKVLLELSKMIGHDLDTLTERDLDEAVQ